MVFGKARPRLRPDGFYALRGGAPPTAFDWPAERGSVFFESQGDLIGGFPGYADRGGLLAGAQVRITERYLLAAEGRFHGFGLPIAEIEGTALIEQPGRDDYALRIFYRSSAGSRLFTLRFRGRIGARTVRRSVGAQQALLRAGVADRFAHEAPALPGFTLPWSQTREFDQENVIWTGSASAPLWVGAEMVPSEVWLTTKSLIWGSGSGNGINRIPLPELIDLVVARLRDRFGTPAIYLAAGDERTGRYEIPFLFDQQTPPDRNFRERGAFLVGLRSRGIPDGVAVPCSQPWRSGTVEPSLRLVDPDDAFDPVAALEDELEPFEVDATDPDDINGDVNQPVRRDAGAEPRPAFMYWLVQGSDTGFDAPDAPPDEIEPNAKNRTPAHGTEEEAAERFAIIRFTEPTGEAADDAATDRLLAEWSSAGAALPSDDLDLAEPWHPDEDDARDFHRGDQPGDPDAGQTPGAARTRTTSESSARGPELVSDAWSSIRRYEESAIGTLSEALRAVDAVIDGRGRQELAEPAPSSADQARALAELEEMIRLGVVTPQEARRRRERLIALGEVCVRLRTLVELHAGGYLSSGELNVKRTLLMRRLSSALMEGNQRDGEQDVFS